MKLNYARKSCGRSACARSRGPLPLVEGVCWDVTAGNTSHNASNAMGVTAGKMGRNSSNHNQSDAILIKQRQTVSNETKTTERRWQNALKI